MGNKLHRIEAAPPGVHHRTVAPEVGQRLGDDAHPHRQLSVRPIIRFLDAHRTGFINGPQALLHHLRGDDEIAARLVVEWHISRTPDGV